MARNVKEVRGIQKDSNRSEQIVLVILRDNEGSYVREGEGGIYYVCNKMGSRIAKTAKDTVDSLFKKNQIAFEDRQDSFQGLRGDNEPVTVSKPYKAGVLSPSGGEAAKDIKL